MTEPSPQAVRVDLLPCPFCGSADIFVQPDERGSGGQWVSPVHVGCNAQTGCGAGHAIGDTVEEASAAWNRRASPALAAETGGEAVADIIAERRRQVEVEGWTPEHDDEHDDRSLALAAACYAIGPSDKSRVQAFHEDVSGGRGDTPTWSLRKRLVPIPWPESWDLRWWKPSPDRRRNLIKAGALIVAEIERLDRKGASK